MDVELYQVLFSSRNYVITCMLVFQSVSMENYIDFFLSVITTLYSLDTPYLIIRCHPLHILLDLIRYNFVKNCSMCVYGDIILLGDCFDFYMGETLTLYNELRNIPSSSIF